MKKIVLLAFSFASLSVSALTIGVENLQYYPHYSYSEDGKFSGFAHDLFELFAQKTGEKISYRGVPVKRLFQDLIEGKVDFKYPDNEFWNQEIKKGKKVYYSDPVVEYVDGVVVAKDRVNMKKEELKNLGTVMGFTAWDYLSDIEAKKIKLMEGTNFSALLRQAADHRIDGVYANIAVAKYQLENDLKRAGELVFAKDLPHTRSSYFVSTTTRPELIEKFNAFLKSEKAAVDELKKKYNLLVD